MSAWRVIETKMSKKWVDISLIEKSHHVAPLIETSHFTCCSAIPCLTEYKQEVNFQNKTLDQNVT